MTQEQKRFIDRVGTQAAAAIGQSRILASLVIAQAILESNWGRSVLAVRANALFGIKAGANWKGRVYSVQTKECFDGANFTKVTALFRAYDSWEDSIKNHASLLATAARYRAVIGEGCYKAAAHAVHAAGYATDPLYATKLIDLIEKYKLYEFDVKQDAGGQCVPGTAKVLLDGEFFRADAVNICGVFFVQLPGLPVRIRLREALESAGYVVAWDSSSGIVMAQAED